MSGICVHLFKLANIFALGQDEIHSSDKRSFFKMSIRFALILERREKTENRSIVSTIAFLGMLDSNKTIDPVDEYGVSMHLDLVLRVVAVTGLLSLSSMVYAQSSEEITLKLKSLSVIKQQESGGDELYISVTEYPAKGTPVHYQVPSFPTHWLSKYLVNVKDIVIWKKNSVQCTPADLLITLVEEDFEPWNMDDSLGSVALKVECVNGTAVEKWSIPDQKTTAKINNETGAFTFDGDGAKYRAQFTVEKNIKLAP